MQKTLYLDQRIAESIEILRALEPKPREYLQGGYYLAFSGGKDSVVLIELAKRSGVVFDAHYHITSADPPEVVHFIRSNYPDKLALVVHESHIPFYVITGW